ncbi:MAG TPA: nitroreductase family deazaflavin-dependent oxidoreductase [Mycobacterium sp.]
MSPLTKILNPAVGKLAGRRFFAMAAALHHVGRRSGTSHVTPVGARVSGDVAIIPLTFGNQSDWVRNVRAAGTCWIRVNGKDYHAVRPQVLDWADVKSPVRSAFNPLERLVFRLLGIKQFMRLDIRSTVHQNRSATA